MTQIHLPIININGTDGNVLAAEYSGAIEALDKAIEALGAITVHGRDYQLVSNTSSGSMAIVQHAVRRHKLLEVRAELELIYTSIFEQLSEREERQSYTGVTG